MQSSKRIKLTEKDDTLVKNAKEFAMKLSYFFSNAVINLKIPKFENFDPLLESTDHPTLKVIVKYQGFGRYQNKQ